MFRRDREGPMKRVLLMALTIPLALCCTALNAANRTEATKAIDQQINTVLSSESVTAAPQAEDAELLRRIYLDVLGRIPTTEETNSYLADDNADKPHRLIDALLQHEEMSVNFSRVFDEWLNADLREREYGQKEFLAYLENALRNNRPWDQIAHDLLLPQADDEIQRGAAYFLAARLRKGDKQEKIDGMTTAVASVFFGVQLQCAKCHDHPYVDDWQQDHYYGLAAFLGRTQEAKIDNRPFMRERADGEVTFVTTTQEEKTAQPMFLDGHVVKEPELPDDQKQWYTKGKGGFPDMPKFSRRQALAEYALNANTPYFKRAIVNRIWKHFMGRGLVEPVDQIHDANPASHPQLLTFLADEFAESGFDLKRLMAAILHSDAYLRSSRYNSQVELSKESMYAVAILKPLSPDQLVTSIGLATGHYEQLAGKYEREKDKRKIDRLTPSLTRALYLQERDCQTFGRQFRNQGEYFEANAAQALFLSYNGLMMKQLESREGSFVEQLGKIDDPQQIVREVFMRVLSRLPEEDELQQMTAALEGDPSTRPDRWRELIWALLCSAEFRFNH